MRDSLLGAGSVHQRALEGFQSLADRPVMLNSIRSSYVEFQIGVLLQDWHHLADWSGWDFERAGVKLEVKAAAARQDWPQTEPSKPTFDIAARTGYYDGIDFISAPGRNADLYIFAWHGEYDLSTCDQRDEKQWEYYVMRSADLPKQKTITLNRLRKLVQPVTSDELRATVEAFVAR